MVDRLIDGGTKMFGGSEKYHSRPQTVTARTVLGLAWGRVSHTRGERVHDKREEKKTEEGRYTLRHREKET